MYNVWRVNYKENVKTNDTVEFASSFCQHPVFPKQRGSRKHHLSVHITSLVQMKAQYVAPLNRRLLQALLIGLGLVLHDALLLA